VGVYGVCDGARSNSERGYMSEIWMCEWIIDDTYYLIIDNVFSLMVDATVCTIEYRVWLNVEQLGILTIFVCSEDTKCKQIVDYLTNNLPNINWTTIEAIEPYEQHLIQNGVNQLEYYSDFDLLGRAIVNLSRLNKRRLKK
jgi:hypothetical protein